MNKSKKYKPKILAVVGPTASGKTALAIELAKKFDGEIVSADSRQIYRGMDIGTAKPAQDTSRGLRSNFQFSISDLQKNTNKEPFISKGILHHLIDIKNPDEEYTVADFKKDATTIIYDIASRKKIPILAGGTGLYIKSVVENLDIPKVKENAALRKNLEEELARNGLENLFIKLVALDPEAAYVVDPKNPRRVIRALEVTIETGKPFTAQRRLAAPLFGTLQIGIHVLVETLRARIDSRIDEMIRDGLEKEAKNLFERYGKVKTLDAIGYREIIDYLEGKSSFEGATAQMKLNTWHYAKRQLTWFRKDKTIQWIENKSSAIETVAKFLHS